MTARMGPAQWSRPSLAKIQRVRLLVRKGQRGLSGAILYGWQNTDAAILGVMDADLQHPPELLPQLLAAIHGGRDMVIGSRYTPGGGVGGWNPVRKLLSSAAVWVTWPMQKAKLRAKDPMSGFFMVRRSCLERDCSFSLTASSCCWRFWCAAGFSRSRRFRLPSAARYRGASKANFKVAGIMRCCWHGSTPGRFGSTGTEPEALARLQRGQQHPQQQKPAHARKEHQRHANAGLAIDLGHQVGGGHIERHAG